MTPARLSPPCLRLDAGQVVILRVFLKILGRSRRPQRGHGGPAHGMELVVARENLDQPAAGVAKHDEILQQVQKSPPLEHALEQGFQFGRSLRGNLLAGDGAPGHEAFTVGGQRTDPRRQPVRDDQGRIAAEQGGDLRLVSLELVERAVQRGVLVAGVLQFDDA